MPVPLRSEDCPPGAPLLALSTNSKHSEIVMLLRLRIEQGLKLVAVLSAMILSTDKPAREYGGGRRLFSLLSAISFFSMFIFLHKLGAAASL